MSREIKNIYPVSVHSTINPTFIVELRGKELKKICEQLNEDDDVRITIYSDYTATKIEII